MEKESTLPKTFQKMLGQLKRLNDQLGITISFKPNEKEIQKQKKEEARKKLLDKIWENWPRKMILNKEVLQMRGNALKNPEIKAFLNKSHVRIEDCALVSFWDEQNRGQEHDCPGFCSPEDIQTSLAKWEWGNVWLARYDYYWGGPKDPVKILFEHTKNNLFKAIGVIQMFPEKMKRAA
jgi:hypothetical protein